MALTFGSLFAGIGGLDLGLERAGMTCRWQIEVDDYCRAVLAKHWPDVPKYGDIREVIGHELERVDIICGGFPCQDISNAGKRAGIGGERSGLWVEYIRLVRVVRPRYVLVENVAALISAGLPVVLGDLAASGYDAEWQCLPAASFGAPHIRDRAFILAYAHGDGRQAPEGLSARSQRRGLVAEPVLRDPLPPSRDDWTANQPGILRVADGVSYRLDELRRRALGNAVVPQVGEWIGRRIMAVRS